MGHHRDGGKCRGTHTTLTDLAAKVVDIIDRLPEVTGYAPGLLQSGKGVTGGAHKVKLGLGVGCVILTVRQSRSVQEVRVYGPDLLAAQHAVAKKLRDNRIPIGFRHD